MAGFPKEVCDILNEELTVYTRKGPGGSYPYHKGSDVIKQMNKAFGHNWSSTVVTEQEKHNQILILVSVSVQGLDGIVATHHGFGSALLAKKRDTGEVIDVGNSYKSAYTTALKKACEQFGIGLTGEDVSDANNTPVPSGGYSKPSYTPNAAPKTGPGPYSPARSAPPAARPSYAPGNTGAPARSPVMSRSAMAPVASAPPTSAATLTGAASDTEAVTNPQIIAIKSLSKNKKISEAELIAQSLGSSSKSSADKLTKAEATRVIKFANGLT